MQGENNNNNKNGRSICDNAFKRDGTKTGWDGQAGRHLCCNKISCPRDETHSMMGNIYSSLMISIHNLNCGIFGNYILINLEYYIFIHVTGLLQGPKQLR